MKFERDLCQNKEGMLQKLWIDFVNFQKKSNQAWQSLWYIIIGMSFRKISPYLPENIESFVKITLWVIDMPPFWDRCQNVDFYTYIFDIHASIIFCVDDLDA